MHNIEPLFYRDSSGIWRWCLVEDGCVIVAVSVECFIAFDDAKRNFDIACLSMFQKD